MFLFFSCFLLSFGLISYCFLRFYFSSMLVDLWYVNLKIFFDVLFFQWLLQDLQYTFLTYHNLPPNNITLLHIECKHLTTECLHFPPPVLRTDVSYIVSSYIVLFLPYMPHNTYYYCDFKSSIVFLKDLKWGKEKVF